MSKLADRVVGAYLKEAAGVLWQYADEEGNEFYLPEKRTGTIRSPYTGKSFTAKPSKFTLSDVGKELKMDSKKATDNA